MAVQFAGRVARRVLEVVLVVSLIAAALAAVVFDLKEVTIGRYLGLVVVSGCFAVAYIGLYRLAVPWLLERATTRAGALVVHASTVLAAALVGAEAAARLVAAGREGESRWQFFGVGLSILVLIRFVHWGEERLQRRVSQEKQLKEEVRRRARLAEIAALQARTDPHFLYNALNSIAALIEEDPERAVEGVTRLAALFRYTLRAGERGSATLAEEMEACTDYLEIQALRFEDRLSWSIEAEEGLQGVEVPPLLLQPSVENAVLHGTRRPGPLGIRLTARRRADQLELAVEDDGPGPGSSGHRGTGRSLADLEERLGLLYGEQAGLSTGRSESGGFRLEVCIPLGATR